MELITGHLLMRRPVAEDAEDALAMLQDPEVVRCKSGPGCRRYPDCARMVRQGR